MMKTAAILQDRQARWSDLDRFCDKLEKRRWKKLGGAELARFASLYRGACADLALADAYQLPPGSIQYLHQLVGRAHNQFYRARRFQLRAWGEEMFVNVPRRLLRDPSLWLATVLFWGMFLSAMWLSSAASPVPGFAEAVAGSETLTGIEEMYSEPIGSGGVATGWEPSAASFYLWHNTTIGLQCFALGLIFGVGGMFALTFNAMILGTMFGHMTTTAYADNFFHFVTAHGPFELTAIVLSSAAGMRLGFSLVDTKGYTRSGSLRRAAKEAMPAMGTAIALFFLAAGIEGFISPSRLPYEIKAIVAVASSLLLMFYFVVLGLPEPEVDEQE